MLCNGFSLFITPSKSAFSHRWKGRVGPALAGQARVMPRVTGAMLRRTQTPSIRSEMLNQI